MNTITVRLEHDFLEKFPDASIHVLVADKVTSVNENVVTEWQQRAAAAVVSWQIDPQRLLEEPWIADWRNAMKKMGVNAAKTRSSIEQLAKRALSGTFIKTPILVVNLYCAVSTIAKAPMGGYRLESLKGDVRVRLAQRSEQFLGIGEKSPFSVPPGVVVYSDDDKVACYAWNHKDSAETCITPQTERAVFFADGVTIEGRGRAYEGIQLLATALASSGSQVLSIGTLDRRVAVLTIPVPRERLDWDEVIHSG